MSGTATLYDWSETRDADLVCLARGDAAGQVATVGDAQSNEVLESRVTRLEVQHARDREELMSRIMTGFADVKTDIANLTFVHPEVFTAWQKAAEARFNQLDSEVVWNRRLLTGSVGGGILVFIGWAVTGVSL